MTKLTIAATILLLAFSAGAETFPQDRDFDYHRTYPDGVFTIDFPVLVEMRFENGEDDDLEGFLYTEQFPDWVSIETVEALLDDEPIAYEHETGNLNDYLFGLRPHRWVFGDPADEPQHLIDGGAELILRYEITAHAPGVLGTVWDGWVGVLLDEDADIGAFGDDLQHPNIHFVSATSAPADGIPSAALLEPALPNPFNPSTRITLRTPGELALRLDVLDARGRLVRRLAEGEFPAGAHAFTWDGRDERGAASPSGLYLARLSGEGGSLQTRKLTLLK